MGLPLWGGASGFGIVMFLVGAILFLTKVGITCCSHDDPSVCEDYKSFCQGPDGAQTNCDEWDSCSSALTIMITGLCLAVVGGIITGISSCGLCACFCFEGDPPPAKVDQ